MTKTLDTFPDPDMKKIIPAMGADSPNTDRERTYLEKKNIDNSNYKKVMNKDVYVTDMHKIYNLIVVQKNEKK